MALSETQHLEKFMASIGYGLRDENGYWYRTNTDYFSPTQARIMYLQTLRAEFVGIQKLCQQHWQLSIPERAALNRLKELEQLIKDQGGPNVEAIICLDI